MDEAEGKALVHTVEKLIRVYDSDTRFKAADLCSMLREWLGSILKGRRKQEYFIAVQSGLDRDYGPMEKIFDEVIARTLRQRGQPFRSVSS